MRIAFIDGGTYYHHATWNDPELQGFFHGMIYTPELAQARLDDFDCLYVASRQAQDDLIAARPVFDAFLAAGRTVVVMGDNGAEKWVPGVQWRSTPVNFWWWLTPGADSGLRIGDPAHGLYRHIRLEDATWHQHGVLSPPDGAVSVVSTASGESVLYDDQVSTAGRLIVTTLDPCYHHGSYFMPATTRFLKGFLPWLAAA